MLERVGTNSEDQPLGTYQVLCEAPIPQWFRSYQVDAYIQEGQVSPYLRASTRRYLPLPTYLPSLSRH